MNEPTFLLNYQTLGEFTEDYEKHDYESLRSKTAVSIFLIKQGYGHCYVDGELIAFNPGTLLVLNSTSHLDPIDTKLVLGSVITFEPEFLDNIDVKKEYCQEIIGDKVSYVLLDLSDDAVTLNFMRTQIHMYSWQYRLYANSLLKKQLLRNILSGILLNIFGHLHRPNVVRVLKDSH